MEKDALIIRCAGIENGGRIPLQYTGRGENRSPAFEIDHLDKAAITLAVLLEDVSHPIQNFPHWVIWNIPATGKIPGAIPAGRVVPALNGARQGVAYGLHRYAGPKPPKGKTHSYRFTVYALDCRLALRAGAGKRAFLKKAKGHILQKGSITAQFE